MNRPLLHRETGATSPDSIVLLPGERLIHGRVWCVNLDMRKDFIACRAMWNCLWHPPVLADLSDDELALLEMRTFQFDCWAQRHQRVFGWPAEAFRIALNAERDRRAEYAAGYREQDDRKDWS